jgi:hypothetical protein
MATNNELKFLGLDGTEQLVANVKNLVDSIEPPYGELSTGSDTLRWDGNREGVVRADDYDQYLITESIPTLADFENGASYTYLQSGTEMSANLGMGDSIYEVDDGCIVVGSGIIVAKKDGATLGDRTYPKKGVYFNWIGNNDYTTSLTINGYNGFPSTKMIEERWIPDTIARKDELDNKLDSSQLSTAINTALDQAKASGEFDGVDGKDGVSVKHVWDGTILTITSANGTSSADLKGSKGDQGDSGVYVGSEEPIDPSIIVWVNPDGEAGSVGKTPVKGIDYYTDADKAEMVSAVIAALPDASEVSY